MLDSLPNELLFKLYDYLGIKDKCKFASVSTLMNRIHQDRMQSRLAAVLAKPTPNQFIQLLTCIKDNVYDGLAILQDETCKKTLLEKRPKELPHWMLGLAECKPDLLVFTLKDEDYKKSLSPDEFDFLVRNYPELDTLVKEAQITAPEPKNEMDSSNLISHPMAHQIC